MEISLLVKLLGFRFSPPPPLPVEDLMQLVTLQGGNFRSLIPSWLNPLSFSTEPTLCGWVYWEEEVSYTCPWLPKHWAMAFKSSLSKGTFLGPVY